MAETCRHRDVDEHGMALERCLEDAVGKVGNRHFCSKHNGAARFDMNNAKKDVLRLAALEREAVEDGEGLMVLAKARLNLHKAVDRLQGLGWTMGD